MRKLFAALLILSLLSPLTACASMAGAAPTASDTDAAIELLQAALNAPDIDESIRLIRQAADSAPEIPLVLLNCARLLFPLGGLDETVSAECEAWLRTALSLSSGDMKVNVLQELVQELSSLGRFDEGIAMVQDEIKKNPFNDQYVLVLASAYYYGGMTDEALSHLDALLEDTPTSLVALQLRANILLNDKRWDEAMDAYEQLGRLFPNYLYGLYGEYSVYLASGQFDRAIRAIDELIRDGGDELLWLERVQIRLWNQYDPEAALVDAAALLRADPEWMDVYLVKLGALLQLERYDEAHAVADEFAETDAAYGELLHGIVCMNEKRWADAEARFEEALRLSPGLYTVWQNIAIARLNGFDDPDGAYDALMCGFAATYGEGSSELYVRLGLTFYWRNDLLEAARAFDKGAAMTAEEPTALFQLMATFLEAGREQDALDALAQLESDYPGWYDTMWARVCVEDTLGNRQQALDAFIAFKEKYPQPASRLVTVEGALRAAAGEPEGADMIREWLDTQETPRPLDYYYYAYALQALDDADGAYEAIAAAEALLSPDNPERAYDDRNAKIFGETTLAELLAKQGDIDGAVEAFRRAAAIGWNPSSLALFPQFAEVWRSDAFQALRDEYPKFEEDWDLTVMPTIILPDEDTP